MEEKGKSRGRPWLVIILALLIAYPLSVGPACWLCLKGFIANEYAEYAIAVFYLPLSCLIENNVQPFANWLMRYIDLWEKLPP